MANEDRRERERNARRRLIVSTARRLAESEGWDAVTTRRLSTEIEYSQPVLYKHFSGMEQLADAVALDGFEELATDMRAAAYGAASPRDTLARIAHAYIGFARDHPAVYDAMFTRTTTLHFAAEDTPSQLESAFNELRGVVALVAGERDPDTLTETFWAALHGVVTLNRAGRLRPDYESDRVQLLIEQFAPSRDPQGRA